MFGIDSTLLCQWACLCFAMQAAARRRLAVQQHNSTTAGAHLFVFWHVATLAACAVHCYVLVLLHCNTMKVPAAGQWKHETQAAALAAADALAAAWWSTGRWSRVNITKKGDVDREWIHINFCGSVQGPSYRIVSI